jgi:catechol 2,3-dioxygenase-like lactoylglutathione lyase family enzyme
MSIVLHRLVLPVADRRASAAFFTEVLQLTVSAAWGPFIPVEESRGVIFDLVDDAVALTEARWSFVVDDTDFVAILDRLRTRDLAFWADPGRSRLGEISHRYGGCGVCFEDPDGRLVEIVTRPRRRPSRRLASPLPRAHFGWRGRAWCRCARGGS